MGMYLGILCTMTNTFGRKGFYNTQEIGLGRALSRMGHQVVIYKCQKKELDIREEQQSLEEGLTIRYLPVAHIGAHGYLPAGIIDPDLEGLLCFSDNQVFTPHIYRYCKKNEIVFVPYVGKTRSAHHGLHAAGMNLWAASGTLKLYRNNAVIAKTETAAKELKKLGAKQISLAPVGLDTSVLKADFRSYDRDALREAFGFGKEDVVVCCVLQMRPSKRPLDLLRIFRNIKGRKQFRFLMIGEGPLREEVDQKILEYGLTEDVKIYPRVPYEDMWKVYTAADYYVNLNKKEIFGMAIMEAVYYEASVAAIEAPGPSLILKDMKGHRLCGDDSQIEEWLTGEYPAAEELRESAEKIPRNFGWKTCAETFVSIVQEAGEQIQR